MRNWNLTINRAMTHIKRVFGQPVTYNPLRSLPETEPLSITAVFDPNHKEVSFDNGMQISSYYPLLTVAGADLLAPPKVGDQVTIEGMLYTVADAQADGAGNYDCPLQEGNKTRWPK